MYYVRHVYSMLHKKCVYNMWYEGCMCNVWCVWCVDYMVYEVRVEFVMYVGG